jgi:ornithine lipid ester-linked acyl 2-hydroxylase
MNDNKLEQIDRYSLLAEIRKGWDWVIFVLKILMRVGGIDAWIRSFKQIISILSSRFSAQYGVRASELSNPILDPNRSFYESVEFPFAALLETNWRTIFDELERIKGEYFIPWSEKYLYKDGWSIFGLYGYGLKIEQNCKLCPETTKLVEQIPNLLTAGFSALAPGTHIAPHTGYPDGVLRCHLGLIIPDNCAIRIGDETRTWQEGKCLIFNDTIEHEAWNRSDRDRIILLLDFKPLVDLATTV